MLDQKDRQIEIIPDLFYDADQIGRLLRVHACCRLIQKQQLRIGCQRTGNLQFPLFSVRKIAGQIVPLIFQIEDPEQLFCMLPHCLLYLKMSWQTKHTGKEAAFILRLVMKTDHDVPDHRHIAEQADVLECSRDSLMVDLLLRLAFQFFPIQVERAGCRKIHTGQHIEYGRFAGAIRADHAVDLSFFDLNVCVLNCFQSAKGDSEIFCL